MQNYIKFFFELGYMVLLSPDLVLKAEAYDRARSRPFAWGILSIASLSWALGLYLLSFPYKSFGFWLYILFATLIQFGFILLSGFLVSSYMDHLIRKRYPPKAGHSEKIELLWILCGLPWFFFTALVILAKSLDLAFLFPLSFLWLGLWSLGIFCLGSREVYALEFRQLCPVLLRALGLLVFFPLIFFIWLSMHILSLTV